MHMAGISPQESWEWTWGEGCEAVSAYNRRENDRAKRNAVALYNAAAFLLKSTKPLLQGGKFESFAEAFPGFEGEQRPTETMSDDALYAAVRALNAQFGGEEET